MDNNTLDRLRPGQRAEIRALLGEEGMRARLLDIGFSEKTVVECVGRSPLGDPKAYRVRGTVIAIRSSDSRNILVREV